MSQGGDRSTQAGRVPFVPALEGLRGFAAVLVVLYHCWLLSHLARIDEGPARALLSTGFFGLNFFFVLSGFVLFLPIVARGGRFGSVKSYAARRAARILPAYYVSIALALLLIPLVATSPEAARASVNVGSIASHLTFLQTEARLLPGYHDPLGFAVNPVLWTLSVEAAFYVTLPIIAARYARRPLMGLVAAVTIAIAVRYAIVHGIFGLHLSKGTAHDALSLFPVFLADFAIGMTGAAAYFRWRGDERVQRLAPFAVLASLVVLVVLMLWAAHPAASLVRPQARASVLFSTSIPLTFGLLALALTLCSKRAQWPVANPVARWLGRVSYGTYLFHFLVIGLAVNSVGFERDGGNVSFYKLAAFVVPTSLAAGWLSYRLIEQPSRRWVRRHLVDPAPVVDTQPVAVTAVSARRSPA